MDAILTALIPASLGLLGGVVGSLIAPWVNWGIEKRRQKLAYRRELVASWRKMIQSVTRNPRDGGKSLVFHLERYDRFYSLKPHLSAKALTEIAVTRTKVVGSTIDAGLA